MTTNTTQLENEMLDLVERVRQEFTPAFAAVRLEVELPKIIRNEPDDGPVSAEIAMYVRRDGDVVDAVEFLLHRNGASVVSADEIESWLRSTFDDVVRRQSRSS